jgi:hypothetical protein
VDYIAGKRKIVDTEMKRHGFERIGEHMYQKDARRVRWVSSADQLQGVEGGGRKFISRWPFDHDIERMARERRFVVTLQIEDLQNSIS